MRIASFRDQKPERFAKNPNEKEEKKKENATKTNLRQLSKLSFFSVELEFLSSFQTADISKLLPVF